MKKVIWPLIGVILLLFTIPAWVRVFHHADVDHMDLLTGCCVLYIMIATSTILGLFGYFAFSHEATK